jgi:hypothetical protein
LFFNRRLRTTTAVYEIEAEEKTVMIIKRVFNRKKNYISTIYAVTISMKHLYLEKKSSSLTFSDSDLHLPFHLNNSWIMLITFYLY